MLNAGQRVRIFLDETALKLFDNPLRKFHGMIATITVSNYYRMGGISYYTYYLDGIQSRFGIPYEFLEEWLVPYDVED